MEKLVLVSELFSEPEKYSGTRVSVGGWVRSVRTSKSFGFVVLNDGSSFRTLQIVYHDTLANFGDISKLNTGASIIARGILTPTPEARQPFEIQAESIDIEGLSAPDYPLQKKRHTLEYLRTMPHLRARTNTFMAVFRVRSVLAYAIHKFFQEKDFVYVHTPIITASDCEGAGEMFQVTTLDLERVASGATPPEYGRDFYGKPTFLTVSGQLNVETFMPAFRNVYTFGPTFRAENSNTPRHAAEFWMIEPEMAFADIDDLIEIEEEMLKYTISYVLSNASDEMEFLSNFVEKGLSERLTAIAESDFGRITYTEAVEILKKHEDRFENRVEWGLDLQTEHERFLTETVYKKPIFVTDYPKDIKAFYMKQNDDGRTVGAVDCLVPGVGEIMGGSQREEDLSKLRRRIEEMGLSEKAYDFYLDLRRYGTVRHSGFGLGFERAVMYITGMQNIRDVLPFPRTTGSCEL